MDTCSIGRVIDALTLIPALPANQALFADVVVVDGPWVESNIPDNLVLIGLTAAGDAESGGVQQPRAMGALVGGGWTEDYGIVCQIRCWTGDADLAAQKLVRDKALALYDVFNVTVSRTNNLGGTYVPETSGQLPDTSIETFGLIQDDADVEVGRVAIFQFTVHVRYQLNS